MRHIRNEPQNPKLVRASNALLLCLLLLYSQVAARTLSDDALAQIRFEQKLNNQVSLALPFQDEEGKPVQLGQYFAEKPVLLVLGYYECPMLCTLVLNGMVETAADIRWSIGREFEVVDVSINPKETFALAAAKKRAYVKRYGRSGAAEGWHFLTGDKASIRELANQVGFCYVYDASSKQYAHPSGLVILTPKGKVSRYLFGVTYSPKELYAALRDASSEQVGSPIRQLILLCFHYNPITGKYSGAILVILRLLGIATVLGFLWLVVTLVRRGNAAQASVAARSENLPDSSASAQSSLTVSRITHHVSPP
jgi:protein SCO1